MKIYARLLLMIVLVCLFVGVAMAAPPEYLMEPDTAVVIVCPSGNVRYTEPAKGRMTVYCHLPSDLETP